MKNEIRTRDRSSDLRERRETCLRAVHRIERYGVRELDLNPKRLLGEEVQTEPMTLSAQLAPNCRARILCADDDPALRACFAKVLARAGYSVTTVADGLEAWESLQSEPCDLLITDNEMPGLRGIELVVKARLSRMPLPIIVATSDVSSFTDPHMQWLSIAALLQKPFGLRELSDAVGQALCAAHQVRWGHDEGSGFRCQVGLGSLERFSG